MTAKEWQALVAWMRSPETQALVAKYEPPEAEEPGRAEPQQAALWEED